jgi:PfaD family protein
MADDITVEADSGGHTDNRPLVSLLPAILDLRDAMQEKQPHIQAIRIGAAGGISTPASALAAFSMGAAYIVTGSVNQACVEAGTSAYVKKQLAQTEMADITMAPCADMFEMGVKVQVLKKGTLFAPNAQKLYEVYKTYPSIEAIPADVVDKLEKRIFKNTLPAIWQEVTAYFNQRDSRQLMRAQTDPKHKMALIFRWYLGNSSRWATMGVSERNMDMQIWCGQAMGAFNMWVKNTYLEPEHNRKVAEVGYHIMNGALFLYRQNLLRMMKVNTGKVAYIPQPLHYSPQAAYS